MALVALGIGREKEGLLEQGWGVLRPNEGLKDEKTRTQDDLITHHRTEAYIVKYG